MKTSSHHLPLISSIIIAFYASRYNIFSGKRNKICQKPKKKINQCQSINQSIMVRKKKKNQKQLIHDNHPSIQNGLKQQIYIICFLLVKIKTFQTHTNVALIKHQTYNINFTLFHVPCSNIYLLEISILQLNQRYINLNAVR